MVRKCCTLLHHIVLQVGELDQWQWLFDPSKGYSVRGVCHMPTTLELPLTPIIVSDSIWHKAAPLKVSLFVWRLLRNQIPTKDNLLRRGIIQSDSLLCVSGCGAEESVDHLFMRCNFFGSILHAIRHWTGIVYVDPFLLSN